MISASSSFGMSLRALTEKIEQALRQAGNTSGSDVRAVCLLLEMVQGVLDKIREDARLQGGVQPEDVKAIVMKLVSAHFGTGEHSEQK